MDVEVVVPVNIPAAPQKQQQRVQENSAVLGWGVRGANILFAESGHGACGHVSEMLVPVNTPAPVQKRQQQDSKSAGQQGLSWDGMSKTRLASAPVHIL